MPQDDNPNYVFWDNLVGQDHRAFKAEDSRPIPVYLFIHCVDDCDIFILGASLGLELYRQIKNGPETVKRVPYAGDLCHEVIQFYGRYKDGGFESDAEADSILAGAKSAGAAYATQIVSFFGEDNERGHNTPGKVYKGLMSKSKPENGPSLEIPELNACEAPQGLMYGDNDGPVWLYLVRPLPQDHANLALEILGGIAFDDWQTYSDGDSNGDSDE